MLLIKLVSGLGTSAIAFIDLTKMRVNDIARSINLPDLSRGMERILI
jgi:hypothetical protein